MSSNATMTAPSWPAAAPATTTVAGYLLARLAEAGVISVFGVPGDYNLGLLDEIVARPGLEWVGMATEQGAACAADSYARQRGLGALVTTFGVGELSAINAMAGAYAESSPVVHIVGTPALGARGTGLALHHNLPGNGYGQFARMAAEVTAAMADLRPGAAPGDEIDRVLRTALRTSRPVYLAIPADVAGAPVPAPADPLQATGQGDHTDPPCRLHPRRPPGAGQCGQRQRADRPPGKPSRCDRTGAGTRRGRRPARGRAFDGQGRLPRV
jgi:alpha-keto-acid decarboxylase